jgi:hypothetical protein
MEENMKNISRMAVKVAGTGALAILLTASAFADSRPQDGAWRGSRGESRGDSRNNGSYNRENDSRRHDNRISESGKIRSFKQERDGYRVYLDRGNYSYWVPQSHLRGHRLSVGLSIRLGGIFDNGYVTVDDLGWPDDGGYRSNDVVRGVVDRVDFRRSTVNLRSDRGYITVDMRSLNRRYSRLGIDDLRRGDRVTLSGDWVRGGLFDARRIDSIGTR